MTHPHSPRPAQFHLTGREIVVLVLIAVLGLSVLGLGVWVILNSAPVPGSLPGVSRGPTATPALITGSQTAAPEQTPLLSPLLAACGQPGGAVSQGVITRVIDAQTLEVQLDGTSQIVGYAGITVHQTALNGGLANRLTGQPVILIADPSTPSDTPGPLLRYIFSGGEFINLVMVRQGLATVQPGGAEQLCSASLQQAQQQARTERLGLWQPTPAPTATFMPLVSLAPSTQVAGCDCSARPTCEDFSTHAAAQACYNACQDYNTRLDDNHDGIACENLP